MYILLYCFIKKKMVQTSAAENVSLLISWSVYRKLIANYFENVATIPRFQCDDFMPVVLIIPVI